jgi:PhnB protein
MAVDPIPAGYPRVTPYLCCRGAADAIEFYKEVLGATERMRMPGDSPDTIGHAELEIGTGLVMLADEFPDMGFLSPQSIGGTPVTVHVYVDDVDAVCARALAKGATTSREVENQFYGDRSGQFVDPWGHRWNVASHVEDVSEEEMGRRMAEMQAQHG